MRLRIRRLDGRRACSKRRSELAPPGQQGCLVQNNRRSTLSRNYVTIGAGPLAHVLLMYQVCDTHACITNVCDTYVDHTRQDTNSYCTYLLSLISELLVSTRNRADRCVFLWSCSYSLFPRQVVQHTAVQGGFAGGSSNTRNFRASWRRMEVRPDVRS